MRSVQGLTIGKSKAGWPMARRALWTPLGTCVRSGCAPGFGCDRVGAGLSIGCVECAARRADKDTVHPLTMVVWPAGRKSPCPGRSCWSRRQPSGAKIREMLPKADKTQSHLSRTDRKKRSLGGNDLPRVRDHQHAQNPRCAAGFNPRSMAVSAIAYPKTWAVLWCETRQIRSAVIFRAPP